MPSIWTRCGGRRNARPLRLKAWRVVESQSIFATRKLVASDAEQERLEHLLEGAKPPVPKEVGSHLHFLLSTPFRYPPLRHGSRFGTRNARGIFYGSVELTTALAEVAYYRLVFLQGPKASLGAVMTQHTAFRFSVRASVGVDLTSPPFDAFTALISSPTDYGHAQSLGEQMREDGVMAALFQSARDAHRGKNLALFSPAFERSEPDPELQEWLCTASTEVVELKRKNLLGPRETLRFPQQHFWVDGRLPTPCCS